jgi:hypothetical protein
MNEKGAVALANTFALCPAQLLTRIDEAFAGLTNPKSLAHAIDVLAELVRETEALVSERQVSNS